MSKHDGGPAFAAGSPHGWQRGMTLRDYFIVHAPAAEIADMIPNDVGGCASYIGLKAGEYKGEKHYRLMLAKARGEWADAMLAERAK